MPWRYLSGKRVGQPTPALFVDRDGVLNERLVGGYVRCPEELVVIERWFPLLGRAQSAGMLLVVVSNQGGIAKELMSRTDLLAITAMLLRVMSAAGIEIDAVYCCPHHPEAKEDMPCTCRKPAPGLLLTAAVDLRIDIARSAMLGDQPSDAAAAFAAGVPDPHVHLLNDQMPDSTVERWLDGVLRANRT